MNKIFCIIVFLASFAGVANAQMTDEQVLYNIKLMYSQGISDKNIAKELSKHGATKEQLSYVNTMPSSIKSSMAKQIAGEEMAKAKKNGGDNGNLSYQLQGNETMLGMPNEFNNNVLAERNDVKSSARRIFGHDIFRSRNLSFESSMNIATPVNYVLGPGDEIIIDVYGASQLSNTCKVAPDGSINITNIGPINVAGMTVSQAQAKVYKAMGMHYQGSQIKLSVGQTRTITVNVLGEVEAPGTYTVSAFATVFNCLYLAGGITDTGTMRNVKISRNGRIISTVDIYDLILNGNLSGNVTLQDNDVINVGLYENLVQISGNVKRPMYYEMKKNESLQSLITFAGGFTGDAFKDNVRVERLSSDGLTVHNVDEWDFSSFFSEDGDAVIVSPVIGRYKNTVSIKGDVFRPGAYKLSDKVHSVKTLVEQAGGLLEQAFSARAVLHRLKSDRTLQTITIDLASILNESLPDVVLQNEDELVISSQSAILSARNVIIRGDVINPGKYDYSEGETLEDLIVEAGGLQESASLVNVEVARRITSSTEDPDGLTTAKIFNLTINNGLVVDGESGMKLMPYDVVTIHRSPYYHQQQIVYVNGEVLYAGTYVLSNKEERISDIIKRAGGLTKKAYLGSAELKRRLTPKEIERKQQLLSIAQTRVDSLNSATLKIDSIANVGINLEKALANPGCSEDIVLQPGDVISISVLNNTVKINGEVLYPNTVSFVDGKKASYYINQAGGVTKTGKKRDAYIIYANGQVSKLSKGPILPGCEIVVPTRVKKEINVQKASQWVGLSSAVASIAAVLCTILR